MTMTMKQFLKMSRKQLTTKLKTMIKDQNQSDYYIGGILSLVRDQKWHLNDGYSTLKEYCEDIFDIKYRRAMYLVQIYNKLKTLGISYKEYEGIGWVKTSKVVGILTVENYKYWFMQCKVRTCMQLQGMVKNHKISTNKRTILADKEYSTITFRLNVDDREVLVEALEHIKSEHQVKGRGYDKAIVLLALSRLQSV